MKALPWNRPAPDGELSARPAPTARSSVAQKAIVATSGLLLFGWTCLHLLGTLTVFAGPGVMDRYAGWLRQGASVPLWGLRTALFGAFALHVALVFRLWARARRARPIGYSNVRTSTADVTARALRWGSVALLALIVGHVLHVSFGVGHPRLEEGRAYANLVQGLASSGWVIAYVAFAALFGLHLAHGLRAALVSLGGLLGERSQRALATALALLIGGGFALVPLAIGWGVVR